MQALLLVLEEAKVMPLKPNSQLGIPSLRNYELNFLSQMGNTVGLLFLNEQTVRTVSM